MKNLCGVDASALTWCVVVGAAGLVLTTVRPSATIGHADESGSIELPPVQILVLELAAVDAVAAGAIAIGDVAALDHEFVNDAVKGGQPICKSWLVAGA